MLDWLLVGPLDGSSGTDPSKPRKPSEIKKTSVDWSCAQDQRGSWGTANPFERKQAMVDFAQPCVVKEPQRPSSAQINRDLKDSMPGWKDFE